MTRFESEATPLPTDPMTKTKILYLGSAHDFDRYTARLILRWLNERTGYRGLIVVHPKASD